jgi:hypothetical protein
MDFLPHKMRIFTWKFLRKSPAFSNLDFSRFLDLTQELLDNSAAFFSQKMAMYIVHGQ